MVLSVKKSDIKTFTYDGSDDMINLDVMKIPPVNKTFKATLKLKNGKEIPAPDEWRLKIWKWWYRERQYELIRNQNRAFVDVANSMLNQRHKIRYSE